MSLYLYVIDPHHRELQREHVRNRRSTDSGVDLISQNKVLDVAVCVCAGAGCTKEYCLPCNLGVEIRTGVVAAALDGYGKPAPYLLLARSSTSLTPLRMSNQIGLADAGYRGELIARVDCLDASLQTYTIPEGRRLFQIVQHNWLPFNDVVLVDSPADLPAPPDNRGGGGFGSTGN
jgi:dUTP pyrophosphatase